MGQAAAGKVNEAAESARQTVGDWTDRGRVAVQDARDAIAQGASQMADRVIAAGNGAREAAAQQANEMANRVKDVAGHAYATVNRSVDQGREQVGGFVAASGNAVSRAAQNAPARDQILLGVAGLAVAAAVGLAYQRKVLEDA